MRADDFEIRNYDKLDSILSKLCELVEKGQASGKDYGMVAAAVLDPSNQVVARLNRPGKDGKRIHAEHAAMEAYQQQYGDIPSGSIVITTLSPCNEHMDERDGPSCTDLINQSSVKKVYCGYMDPTQDDDTRQFNVLETANKEIRQQCKAFADTFLGDIEEDFDPRYNVNEFAADDAGDEENTLLKYARMWYNGNSHIQYKIEKILDRMGWEIGEIESEEGGAFVVRSGDENGDTYIGFAQNDLSENFADGKNPQDKGDSKRHGVPTKSSVSSLRKFAKSHSGRAAQLAHWMANMKSGRKK